MKFQKVFNKECQIPVSHLICNHVSRKVVLQTQIIFSGQPLFSNQKKNPSSKNHFSHTRFLDVMYGWSLSGFICEASKNTFTSRLLHHGSLTSKVDLASDSSLSYILWQRRNHPRRFGRKIHLKTGHVHAILCHSGHHILRQFTT